MHHADPAKPGTFASTSEESDAPARKTGVPEEVHQMTVNVRREVLTAN